jgi:hypothetical protein
VCVCVCVCVNANKIPWCEGDIVVWKMRMVEVALPIIFYIIWVWYGERR